MSPERSEWYLGSVIRERRLTSFFVLAYALAWGVELVPDLTGMTQPSWTSWFFAGFLGALAPSVAAAIVVWASGENVREWFRSVAKVRVHPKWYGAAIVVPFLIVYAAGIVSWWVDREHLFRDIAWGVAGFILALLVTAGIALGFQSLLEYSKLVGGAHYRGWQY
ncbi:hypothetical protein ACFQGE_17940 [Halomicroarcula sp. GCM10025817]|uniref:hypothetical protein n=1 Tax=Haloarcula TaxID=2237 RepID=UPI0023E84EDE|nr:hypothetical protein [Halomicroarcula sp. SYNS111]